MDENTKTELITTLNNVINNEVEALKEYQNTMENIINFNLNKTDVFEIEKEKYNNFRKYLFELDEIIYLIHQKMS
jgi:hypothetical protein